ncbi:MAG: hypothetical protein EVA70_01670 [Parvularculaceae bacterium]|nr:MAG: hypothetical protein EVA70_01670 [Parvularculaceae bacterium]
MMVALIRYGSRDYMRQTKMTAPNRIGELAELYRRRAAMAALEVISEAFDVPLSRLTMATRQRANVAFARQIAMYLCHVIAQLSVRDISTEFERERSTVVYALHTIEDRRDSPLFEDQLELLEIALRQRLAVIAADLIKLDEKNASAALPPPIEVKSVPMAV